MGKKIQLLNLHPIEPVTEQDIKRQSKVPSNTSPHSPYEDEYQLQIDVINVVEGRVDIKTFDEEYQKKIKSYYQFSATPHLSKYPVIAKRTRNTLDIV